MDIFERIEPYLADVAKPARYIGGEKGIIIKDKEEVSVRFALCFPDVYDIGMSHIGMKILYSLQNKVEDCWCERVFAPWQDFEEVMRKLHIPLYGLESGDPIKDFDIVGFTLQYEMSYTTILNMLDLAGIPLLQRERAEEGQPIVCAGGPCACNPEPLADFFDLFLLGDGEELNLELIDLYSTMKKEGSLKRSEFLRRAARIEGVYVPSLYDIEYNADGTVKQITARETAPPRVRKRIVTDLDKAYFPENFVVPFTEIVHDRAVAEVLRGCLRGCRFCQAGFIYRPFREKKGEAIVRQATELCKNTGYDRLSLSSLSTSDHSEIGSCLSELLDYTAKNNISISLPSMRADAFSDDLVEKIKAVSKTGLTFAAEAGTQRLRNVINKNLTEDEILVPCRTAFEAGYFNVKLYFMIGHPTETDEDIVAIAELAEKVVQAYYDNPKRPRGKQVQVSLSAATFVPKPFTPFQYERQISPEEAEYKQRLLLSSIRSKRNIKISFMDSRVSLIEALLARGDRRVGAVLYDVWKKGGNFEAWEENFSFERWAKAMEKEKLDFGFYANRQRSYEEVMPWSHLDYMIDDRFLIAENKKAHAAETTPQCRERCSGCGMMKVCPVRR